MMPPVGLLCLDASEACGLAVLCSQLGPFHRQSGGLKAKILQSTALGNGQLHAGPCSPHIQPDQGPWFKAPMVGDLHAACELHVSVCEAHRDS